jgi:hypothetical protein
MDVVMIQVAILIVVFFLAIILGLQIQINGLYRRLEEIERKTQAPK